MLHYTFWQAGRMPPLIRHSRNKWKRRSVDDPSRVVPSLSVLQFHSYTIFTRRIWLFYYFTILTGRSDAPLIRHSRNKWKRRSIDAPSCVVPSLSVLQFHASTIFTRRIWLFYYFTIIPETSIGKMIANYINECFYWSIVQATTTYLE